MKSKKIICAAVAAVMTMSVAFSGCGLLSTLNEENMKQTIATVDISKSDKFDSDMSSYVQAVGEEVIVKRDLITAFVNVGSTYVNNYGMSYSAAFTTLMDELTNNAIVVQYATAYVLKTKDKDTDSDITLAGYNAKTSKTEKLEYLLGGEHSDGVLQAKYNLYSSLNNVLDSNEQTDDEEDKYVGTETRSTPTGIDTTVEDYLPLTEDTAEKELDYGVYTGYEGYLLKDSGRYQDDALEKTNRNTRRQAYSKFITSIKNNYLLTEEDEDLKDILQLSYVKSQYVSQLQQSVINEFNDIYNAEQEAIITAKDENGVYTFVQEAYNGKDGLLGEQAQTNTNASTFESSMNSLSDTSFVLYAPDTTNDTDRQTDATDNTTTYGTFGYVYNILLPFSTTQNNKLSQLQGYRDNGILDDSGYFAARNEILKNIKTTDQRTAWFNGQTDYSFNVEEYNSGKAEDDKLSYYSAGSSDRNYLFFENNLTKTAEYEKLEKYTGLYSYNGKVTKNKDGSYKLVPNKLTIDDMLAEFSAYINFALGMTNVAVEVHAGDTMSGASITGGIQNEGYYGIADFKDAKDESKIDYSKLVYATGKVTAISNLSNKDMFNAESDRYKVMAAVNELQYAYTTDTGVLSQYIGYTVSAYETNYIKEFEYAAQQALRMGVGAFKVCAGDYGWHLIYVTEAFNFNGGDVYEDVQFTADRVEKKGTFENKFYEWIKDKTLSNETTQKRTEILQYYSTDTTVIKYEKAYKDLMELN